MFDENLNLFMDVNHGFAVNATWQTLQIPVIFDRAYLESLGISSSNPVALAVVEQMPNVARGQAIQIETINYVIDDIQPDGTGMVLLQLKKAA